MEVQEMRQVFIDSAVRVVARDGMEKTTTKAIASEAKLNEAYIYKCFSGKDDLLSAALHMEDVNFANLLQKTLPIMHMPGLSWKERAYILWKKSWELVLSIRNAYLLHLLRLGALCVLWLCLLWHGVHLRNMRKAAGHTASGI